MFGVAPVDAEIKINPYLITSREIKITGSCINRYTYRRSITTAHDMSSNYLSLEKLGIKLFDLEEYEAAFKELRSSKISKGMFKVNPEL